jgi:hypothetical protein
MIIITSTTTIIADQKPALKISPIAWQLANVILKNTNNDSNAVLIFI